MAEAGCAIAYVNQVGGQDELVFDGDSLIMGADGTLLASGAQFATDFVVVDLPLGPRRTRTVTELLPRVHVTDEREAERPALAPPPVRPPLSDQAEVYAALVLGTHDYLSKNGFAEAVIGLSGGIDSSLVATVAVDALGPARVHGIAMPSRYSSDGSRQDAEAPGRTARHRSARSCRSRRPTWRSPPCWRRCSGASPSGSPTRTSSRACAACS